MDVVCRFSNQGPNRSGAVAGARAGGGAGARAIALAGAGAGAGASDKCTKCDSSIKHTLS